MTYEYLDANRAPVNESEAKGMAGCIADNQGVIYLYVPIGKRAWAIALAGLLNAHENLSTSTVMKEGIET